MSFIQDTTDARLLDILQSEFPLVARPFDAIAQMLATSRDDVIARVSRLKSEGVIRQLNAIFDSAALGYRSALVAFNVEESKLDSAAEMVSRDPGVSHCYSRGADYNLWFTITVGPDNDLDCQISRLSELDGVKSHLILPALRIFKIGVFFKMAEEEAAQSAVPGGPISRTAYDLSPSDRAAVKALQQDLPLIPAPFTELAAKVDVNEDELLENAHRFLELGIMRRFAAVLRHQRAGYQANAMVCWRVETCEVEEIGKAFASDASVSHCYERPVFPDWPYSLYTMVHARTPEELSDAISRLAAASGGSDYLVLHTLKEYKKTRVIYFTDKLTNCHPPL